MGDQHLVNRNCCMKSTYTRVQKRLPPPPTHSNSSAPHYYYYYHHHRHHIKKNMPTSNYHCYCTSTEKYGPFRREQNILETNYRGHGSSTIFMIIRDDSDKNKLQFSGGNWTPVKRDKAVITIHFSSQHFYRVNKKFCFPSSPSCLPHPTTSITVQFLKQGVPRFTEKVSLKRLRKMHSK